MTEKKRVLFVCMGNICRSPAGEGVFRHLVNERGLADQFEIDSAGTTGYHVGEPPDARMTRAASKRGYRLDGASRQFTVQDFTRFDVIIAMDNSNLHNIRRLDPDGSYAEKVHLMLDFHPGKVGQDVPDPYYGGDKGFEKVIDLVEEASQGLLAELLGKDS